MTSHHKQKSRSLLFAAYARATNSAARVLSRTYPTRSPFSHRLQTGAPLVACAILYCSAVVLAQGSDHCATPTAISGLGPFAFNTTSATPSFPGPGGCFPGGGGQPTQMGNDVWFLWYNDVCGGGPFQLVEFSTCGPTAVNTMIATYQGVTACPTAHPRCCNDDEASCTPQSRVRCETSCCDPVLIQIGNKPNTTPGPGTFSITCLGIGDCGRPGGGCCLPDGTCKGTACCEERGGTFLGIGNNCQGDTDGDGIDEACCDHVTGDLAIDLTTGVDDDPPHAFIPIGSPDDTWTVTCDTAPHGPPPRSAVVVDAAFTGVWQTLPGSQWVSGNFFGPNGDYCYETCFHLCDGFRNARLGFSLRADDDATVRLNGNLLPVTPQPAFTGPPGTFATGNQALFQAGRNCLQVVVHNLGGAPTGMDMRGEVRVENAQCCCRPLENGSSCNAQACPATGTIERCRPRCLRFNSATGQTLVSDCQCRGIDACHAVSGAEGPTCDGGCPPDQACVQSRTTIIDPVSGMVSVEVCCDCEEVCPSPEPPALGDLCTYYQTHTRDCVGGAEGDTCLPRSVTIFGSPAKLYPLATACTCGPCGLIPTWGLWPTTGLPYVQALSCGGPCTPPDDGTCQFFRNGVAIGSNISVPVSGLAVGDTIRCDCDDRRGCRRRPFDADGDGDIDLRDYAVWQNCFSGPE